MNRYDALKHAVKAHAHEIDRCGKPAILHPIAVSEALERGDGHSVDSRSEPTIVAALLHDVLEDTDYRPPCSSFEGALLNALTRRPDEPYSAYLCRVCSATFLGDGPLHGPMFVKLADIWHNLQPERQACLPEKERKSLEKRYLKARARIWEALGYRWWPEGEQ